MVDELDIYRSAQTLIVQHGDQLSIHGAMRADKLLDQGDVEGAATLRRIIRAIEIEFSPIRQHEWVCGHK